MKRTQLTMISGADTTILIGLQFSPFLGPSFDFEVIFTVVLNVLYRVDITQHSFSCYDLCIRDRSKV
ncbi:MAG: hypothetical protein OEZ21_09645 [Candidatus Bathyarchaeota archaeon]|nr:hypothetical protein [Candidatus Bathyarchaeota archaeon]